MPSQPELGKRLAQLRRSAGMSQSELAGDDLSTSYVSLLEAGKREPTAHLLQVLADRLGTTIEYLVGGIDPERRKRLELDLRYAELARRNGEAVEANRRFLALVDEPDVERAGLLADALYGAARTAAALGRKEDALRLTESLVRVVPDDPAHPLWWPAHNMLVGTYSGLGDNGHAADVGERALVRAAAVGELETEAGIMCMCTVAAAHIRRGDLVRAQVLLDRSAEAGDRLENRQARGAAYWNSSVVAEMEGRYDEALRLAERAEALFAESDHDRYQASLRGLRGVLLLRVEPPRVDEATAALEKARQWLAGHGSPDEVGYFDGELARSCLMTGRLADAIEVASAGIERLGDADPVIGARMRVIVMSAWYGLGEPERAEEAYRLTVDGLRPCRPGREVATVWRELAEVCRRYGRVDDALDAYAAASAIAGVHAAPTEPMPALVALPGGVAALEGAAAERAPARLEPSTPNGDDAQRGPSP